MVIGYTGAMSERPHKPLQVNLRSLFFLTAAIGGALTGWRLAPSLHIAIVWEVLFCGLIAWIAFRPGGRQVVSRNPWLD